MLSGKVKVDNDDVAGLNADEVEALAAVQKKMAHIDRDKRLSVDFYLKVK